MKEKNVLNKYQKNFLDIFSKDNLSKNFYLTGGTALSAFYLKHRISEDLDFFSTKEFDLRSINIFLKANKKYLGYKKLTFTQSFNRNIYFIYYNNKHLLKIEFTYFPFDNLERGLILNNLRIDSLLDIAVNKLFSIYQQTKARDFVDLFFICRKTKYTINDLIKKAQLKFDFSIDKLQLAKQFLLAREVKDYPKMLIKFDKKQIFDFYEKEAKNLAKEIIK
ncbi:MAG: nucleotidyl transferase AbiEii/AbiGii toxin family protein [Minisyncoccia bacterium]